jgi:17beta-estradiol 17-dehydrogenase / very-long-chain 3-oxoacyl-CoA reductase
MARNQDKLATTKDLLLKHNPAISVEPILFDFGKAVTAGEWLKVEKAFGGKAIRVLINNVGISHDHPEFFSEMAADRIETMINVNILNTLRLTRMVLAGMMSPSKKQERSLILNMGSFSGETPIPLLQTYSASKAFLKTWSRALAAEVAPAGIDVQLVNPYFVVSNMSKFKRPSLLIPTPADYVRATMRVAGQSPFVTPYMPHALLGMIMGWVPERILVMFNYMSMAKVRSIALAKAEKAAKAN